MAEEARAVAQTDYLQIKQKFQELVQEKTMLEAILTEKNIIMSSEMTVWLSAREIIKYYKSGWRDKMGVRVSHEGIITGYVHED